MYYPRQYFLTVFFIIQLSANRAYWGQNEPLRVTLI